jgi:ornithine cyclodeaminase
MPASDGDIAITKLVAVPPAEPGRGLPTIQGEVVVMEATTGRRLGILDGSLVTASRTAHSLFSPPGSWLPVPTGRSLESFRRFERIINQFDLL